jgi:hypothetical protein
MFEEIMRDQNAFSAAFAVGGGSLVNVEANGELSRASIKCVTGSYYSVLGAVPEIGRLIEPTDVDLNAAHPALVAVLGHDFWERQYGGAKNVIGQTLKIESVPFTIIGVTGKEFVGTSVDMKDDIVVPLNAEPLIYGTGDVQKSLQRPTYFGSTP